jgi:hypothetical protein
LTLSLCRDKGLGFGLFFPKGSQACNIGSGVFSQMRPVWVGDLGTRPEIQKVYGFGMKIEILNAKCCKIHPDVNEFFNILILHPGYTM